MKINIFVPTRNGGKFTDYSINYSSITGEDTGGPSAPEDQIITEIDESRMSPNKILATRFLSFLSDRNLTIDLLKQLPVEEQARIRKEFLGR